MSTPSHWLHDKASCCSAVVRGRRPLGKDPELDYTVMSDEEWEEEPEGESLSVGVFNLPQRMALLLWLEKLGADAFWSATCKPHKVKHFYWESPAAQVSARAG